MTLTNFPQRYARNQSALSSDECAALGAKRVLIVGCGGLGGFVVESLARTGVGYIGAIDGDVFSESNLNRQLFCTEQTIGQNKAEAACRRIKQVNSQVTVEPFACFLTKENAAELVAGYDCVVDALDSVETRTLLHTTCSALGIPLVHGAIAGWHGQVGVSSPDSSSDIFANIFGTSKSNGGIESEHGNLSPTAQLISSIQAAETLKILLDHDNILYNKILIADLQRGTIDTIELA